MNEVTALEIYSKWLDSINSRDWEEFEELLALDSEFTFTHLLPLDSATLHGRDQILASFQGWTAGFDHLRGEILDSVNEGDRTSVQLWWRGTTTNGRPVEFASSHWATVSQGKIIELVDYFDQKTYDEQVGR